MRHFNALVENSAQGGEKPSWYWQRRKDWKYQKCLPGEDETEQEPEAVSQRRGHWSEVVRWESSYSHGSEEQN